MSQLAWAETLPVTAPPRLRAVPPRRLSIPDILVDGGKYLVCLARTRAEVNEALRLRFQVFNVEMGQGLAYSWLTGRDEDPFDATSQHLLALEKRTGEVIGTYRLRASETALAKDGFYTAHEFGVSDLPGHIVEQSIELGRACIARPYRNTRVLFLLWRGLLAYLAARGKRYFFGSCSLTGHRPDDGWRAWHWLRAEGHLHPRYTILPRPGWECPPVREAVGDYHNFPLPRLFRAYLRFGAQVCSPPALDAEFGTTDFFVLLDTLQMPEPARQMLCASGTALVTEI